MIVGLLDMVSAGFLLFGIVKIWQRTRNQPNDPRLNIPQLLLHFSSFVLYLAATILVLYYHILYTWNNEDPDNYGKRSKQLVVSTIASNYLNVVGQVLLAWILYPITKPEE